MTMPDHIDNTDDVIDSRDIIARIQLLEELRDEHVIGAPDGTETPNPEGWREEYPDDAEELDMLTALADEAKDYAPDWEYGATLIRETYFVDYCQELVEDIGDLPKGLPSYIEIDWTATARNIRMDYTEVEFGGVTYLIR